MKVEMNLTKECGMILICGLFSQMEGQENTLQELYAPLFSSDNLQLRIIASKYLLPISRQAKNKE